MKIKLLILLVFIMTGCSSFTSERKSVQECISLNDKQLEEELYKNLNFDSRDLTFSANYMGLSNEYSSLYKADFEFIEEQTKRLESIRRLSTQLVHVKRNQVLESQRGNCKLDASTKNSVQKEIEYLDRFLSYGSKDGVIDFKLVDIEKRLERSIKLKKSIVKQQEELALNAKTDAKDKANYDNARSKFYLSNKGLKYEDKNSSLQLTDFNLNKLNLRFTNTSSKVIVKTKLAKCELIKNELGGESCYWVPNGLRLTDSFGNNYSLYVGYKHNRDIYPDDEGEFILSTQRVVTGATLTLYIPKYVFDTKNSIKITFSEFK